MLKPRVLSLLLSITLMASGVVLYTESSWSALVPQQSPTFESIPRSEVMQLLSPNVNYYQVLGLETGGEITRDKLRVALRKLHVRFHIDRARGDPLTPLQKRVFATKDEVQALWAKITAAEETLGNPRKKAEYDRTLAGTTEMPGVQGDEEAEANGSLGGVGGPPVDEREVAKYVWMLHGRSNVYAYLEKLVKSESELLHSENFLEALKRYFFEVIEIRFGERRPIVRGIRRVMPEPYNDPLRAFYSKDFNGLYLFLTFAAPDETTQLAIHLLVLDRINRAKKPNDYLLAIMFTLGKLGHVAPQPPLDFLTQIHFSPEKIIGLFTDTMGARIVRGAGMSKEFYLRLIDSGVRYFVIYDRERSETQSELLIRAAMATSYEWNRIMPGLEAESVKQMAYILERDPSAWAPLYVQLVRGRSDTSNSRYSREAYKRLMVKLEPVYRRAARQQLRSGRNVFGWIKQKVKNAAIKVRNVCSVIFSTRK